MNFARIAPSPALTRFVECFWMIEDESQIPRKQKIVPDGFPELIVHLADPYKINISGAWEEQTKSLLAGQIRKHFFLQNTGASAVFGIKFKPAALTLLFGIEMSSLTDRVIDLATIDIPSMNACVMEIEKALTFGDRISIAEQFLITKMISVSTSLHPIEKVLESLSCQRGAASVIALADEVNIGKRQLELHFKKYVGLSPKFYSRIIRFSKIFEFVQHEPVDWSDVVHLSGYYDQPHFIKNFKAFTGEEPSRYGFDTKDFANFFLRKPN